MLTASRRLVVALASISLGVPVASRTQATTANPLPHPTGNLAVGTTIAFLVDSARPDSYAARHDGRTIAVQLWYPAAATSHALPRAPYLAEPGLEAAMRRAQYYGVDSAALAAWGRLLTHAALDAPPMYPPHARAAYPLVTLSPGMGLARANYTSIAEELASHGYIVATIDHPHEGLEVLRDGRVLSTDDDSLLVTVDSVHRARVTVWTRDLSYVLDRLAARTVPPPMQRVAAMIDWSRVAAIGHSSGGLVAAQACSSDRRVHACVNMDGGLTTPTGQPMADWVADGVVRPTLLLDSKPLYSDADLAKRGRTRAQWDAMGESMRRALDTLRRVDAAPLYLVKVAGTGHMNFSDAPFVMPNTITRFGGRIIDPTRGWTVITGTLRAFLGQALPPTPQLALEPLTQAYPELEIHAVGRAVSASGSQLPAPLGRN